MHDELAHALREMTHLLREVRAERDELLAWVLSIELARHAKFTRKLEQVAAALSKLDASAP